MPIYAHTKGADKKDWQPLEEHSSHVAEYAGRFAAVFGAQDIARLCGFLHDIGKGSSAFQRRLEDSGEAVDHSSFGVQRMARGWGVEGLLPAYAIAGHHGGLLDGIASSSDLLGRLKKGVEPILPEAESLIPPAAPLSVPDFLKCALGNRDAFAASFFTRMLFSCLVDADYLDTEFFADPERAASRPWPPERILEMMEGSLERFRKSFKADSEVNRIRAEIYEACVLAAGKEPGFFTLNVPTGGGKTLSSMAFALRHALLKGKRRIIYVAPFTSIIEQNAEVFRKAFCGVAEVWSGDFIIEHHSAYEPEGEEDASRLACENWDAPLIVTSSVQFYESLFAAKPSACRKLHNIANSIVVLDEAQTLPVDFLKPCLAALKELVANYKVSAVLCTATQPAIARREGFAIGIDLPPGREIASDPADLHRRLKRVETCDLGLQPDLALAALLREREQALCIVNTRGHARDLMKALGEGEGNFHLSALMCPAHRTNALEAIRSRLAAKLPCRVVSTQLVEAGVDLDFPVVFRSLAGLDSIAQAAGRCNRNGLLPKAGELFVFRSERQGSERFLSESSACAAQAIEAHHKDSMLSLAAIESYFKLYYWTRESLWDKHGVCDAFKLDGRNREMPFLFNFKTAAERFKLIENGSRPVVVPWEKDGAALCERLAATPFLDRETARRLQRFTVQIPERLWLSSVKAGALKPLFDGALALPMCVETQYSRTYGLDLEIPSGQAYCM